MLNAKWMTCSAHANAMLIHNNNNKRNEDQAEDEWYCVLQFTFICVHLRAFAIYIINGMERTKWEFIVPESMFI